MQRRNFLRISFAAAAISLQAEEIFVSQPKDSQKVATVAFPEKQPLITYSNRPPLLETPIEYFDRALTPNELFFVRWHMPIIPTVKWLKSYHLVIDGEVENPLTLSINSLKKEFQSVEVTAVMQCGGNSRSAFHPTPYGIQWGNGAMGCARFKGVRLKDILKKAGLKSDASWLLFNGGDRPVKNDIPDFQRELALSELRDDIIVAYEQNGEDIPFLNGYPLRLIIPGYYADSWVKQLTHINVTKEYTPTFFMDVAYRIPKNECRCETPDRPAPESEPLSWMNVKSVIAKPSNHTRYKAGSNIQIKGVAFDGGSGIKKVEISVDGGKSWKEAKLGKELSKYAFRTFTLGITPLNKGKMMIMAKATNNKGETQPVDSQIGWNHGGYGYNGIDTIEVEII